MRCLTAFLVLHALAAAGYAQIAGEVRADIARNGLDAAESRLAEWRKVHGVTPEGVEALSWLARDALAARSLERADKWAEETLTLAAGLLKGRALDGDRWLPIAVGAAIEVHAQVLDAQGDRGGAVTFLNEQMESFRGTSIVTRIQKNLNLLSLEGKPAPPLELERWIGSRPQPLSALKGKVVLLFFWAHWCGDCKGEAPVLAQIREHYGSRGLVVVAPTQLYGYVAGGEQAPPEEESRYIAGVQARFYSGLGAVEVPLSAGNFRRYGVSTTPTLVIVGRKGTVELYHPGALTYRDLAARVEAALGTP
jgi:thiol-disulfide isomerase/thioredoxin